jgi:hypothetical protein
VQGIGDLDLDVLGPRAVLLQELEDDRQAEDAEILILGMVPREAAVLDPNGHPGALGDKLS